jgi:hypothetical protein
MPDFMFLHKAYGGHHARPENIPQQRLLWKVSTRIFLSATLLTASQAQYVINWL